MCPSDDKSDPRLYALKHAIEAALDAAKANGTTKDDEGDEVTLTPILVLSATPKNAEEPNGEMQLTTAVYGNGHMVINMLTEFVNDMPVSFRMSLVAALLKGVKS